MTLAASTSVDVSALLLGPDGRVRSDADLVFYNQPSAPGVEYRRTSTGHLLVFDATAVPAGVDTVAVAASLDGTGPATFAAAGPTAVTVSDVSDTALVAFTADALGDESALVGLEFYRRGEQWKIRAVGQGYADGLAGLATAFSMAARMASMQS